ncbi:MAG: TerB family tellurite resistance protein, partial [Alphaproteobacteria bacterium]|nr:TerB family tellurite resistance protein [Alphaproteobacteria bacterium]
VNPDPFERRQVAVAALLIEASRLDGHYDAVEQGTVVRLLRETLQLPADQARNLLGLAEARQANTYDNWIFCEAIKKGYSMPERIDIVTHLWQVALVDGQLHRMETLMIDRVAKELELTPAQAAAAKEAAQKKK